MWAAVGKASLHFGVCIETIRRWCTNSVIEFKRTFGGHRRIWLGKHPSNDRVDVAYVRVSSNAQKDDLERQASYMKQSYPGCLVIKDIGSGLNWKRPGFRKLVKLLIDEKVGTVYCAYRDRLTRFAFDFVDLLATLNGSRIYVERSSSKSDEETMCEDLMSIIHVFNCRMQGRRKYKRV